jgi:hypothetical protein
VVSEAVAEEVGFIIPHKEVIAVLIKSSMPNMSKSLKNQRIP